MNVHPDLIGQLAQERQREMQAGARRRQLRRDLRHQQDRKVRTFSAVSAITRRLAVAIAKVGRTPDRVPDATWPARPLSPSETPAE